MSDEVEISRRWKPSANPWLIAATVALAAFMEVLDTSIANVALPHIAGDLGASTDQGTWVLTSYLVSNAIILPVGAWRLASSAAETSFCYASPSSPRQVFFAVSPRHSRSCS